MMEKTLVILKPCTLQRGLVGEITNRFERKGLRLAGMKMVQLTDEILNEHYAHLSAKPFFQRVKDSMMSCNNNALLFSMMLTYSCFSSSSSVDASIPENPTMALSGVRIS